MANLRKSKVGKNREYFMEGVCPTSFLLADVPLDVAFEAPPPVAEDDEAAALEDALDIAIA